MEKNRSDRHQSPECLFVSLQTIFGLHCKMLFKDANEFQK